MVILQDIPLHHHFMSFSTKLNFFAHKIANIINAQLCLVRYCYLPTLCIQPKDTLPLPFVGHTVCIYYIRQALLKLSMIFSEPFVPAKSSMRKSFLVLDFVSVRNYSFHPVFEYLALHLFLKVFFLPFLLNVFL